MSCNKTTNRNYRNDNYSNTGQASIFPSRSAGSMRSKQQSSPLGGPVGLYVAPGLNGAASPGNAENVTPFRFHRSAGPNGRRQMAIECGLKSLPLTTKWTPTGRINTVLDNADQGPVTQIGMAEACVQISIAVACVQISIAVACVQIGVAVACVQISIAVACVQIGMAVACVQIGMAVACVQIGMVVACVEIGMAEACIQISIAVACVQLSIAVACVQIGMVVACVQIGMAVACVQIGMVVACVQIGMVVACVQIGMVLACVQIGMAEACVQISIAVACVQIGMAVACVQIGMAIPWVQIDKAMVSHRLDPMYLMSGSKVSLQNRYGIDEHDVRRLQEMTQIREGLMSDLKKMKFPYGARAPQHVVQRTHKHRPAIDDTPRIEDDDQSKAGLGPAKPAPVHPSTPASDPADDTTNQQQEKRPPSEHTDDEDSDQAETQ
ncbi:hypothetical protein EGW08_005195 [Elysia chlorotica]|uniref:Uncharacterized protein n=1 Tax=Elysia chlorotica TaxID=188477 RepID=A0A433TZP5_ELYCH|nr:hypothetical protein EGW08_005195 [Elysia chlorotica]